MEEYSDMYSWMIGFNLKKKRPSMNYSISCSQSLLLHVQLIWKREWQMNLDSFLFQVKIAKREGLILQIRERLNS